MQNADESAVDCAAAKSGRGGQTCAQCVDGAACRAASDCMDDSHCENGVCASCFNGVADGTESGVDCGGNTCDRRCEKDDNCFVADRGLAVSH